MKNKTIYLCFLLILSSCKTNNQNIDEEILFNNKFDKRKYYKYDIKNMFLFTNDQQKNEYFKPILYVNIKPLDNSKNEPIKIYALRSDNDVMEM